jgi:hypothetical protein
MNWLVTGKQDSILTHLINRNVVNLGSISLLLEEDRHDPNLVLFENFNRGTMMPFTAIFEAIQVDMKR